MSEGNMNDERVPPGSKFLAHGAAAEVWLVKTPNSAIHQCVLKMIRLNLETLKENYGPRGSKRAIQLWKQFTDVFRSKVAQWKLLADSNVVRVLDLDENLHLRVEYLAHGSASQIHDVLAGLYYLHSQSSPVVHGCIRMDKLFVDANGTTKIGEFGLASLLGDFEFFAPSITQAGQVRWMSPELLQTNTDQRPIPTTASDIWALGCTLFEIVSGKLPYSKYKHDLRTRHEIVSKKAPGLPENLLHPDFAAVWTLITSCWEWDHEQRPSVHKLVQYIYLPFGVTLAPVAQESQNINTFDPGNHGLAKSIMSIRKYGR
ncbi:unnamed protein product [Rhizoctonia solani]|uniref:Protein kinase domain-containing protein n=1 Tax=Rhizoctonia solani TaxID=456999 RepID=A0A8H3GM85_9AGAM|nr:unnamed protein product [Rhizoctonia solani]